MRRIAFPAKSGALAPRGGASLAFGIAMCGASLLLAPRLSSYAADEQPDGSNLELSVPTKPVPAEPTSYPRVFGAASPDSLDDLRMMEAHVEYLLPRVSPAVVAVEVQGASGSAVVISPGGLVLSAAHVCAEPGENVEFTFPDGQTARGKTLGTNHEVDSGLMIITDPGTWPYVPVGELKDAGLGDWVMGLGHPGGFDAKRPVVLRLGRIIWLTDDVLQSDCTLMAGDSGGPLFDMYGRVVGIHSRISESAAANFHVPITTYFETWNRLAQGEDWGRSLRIGISGAVVPDGFLVEKVEEESSASRAGLQVGDLVTKLNDRSIRGFDSFQRSIDGTESGREAFLQIKRGDEELTLSFTVERRRGGRGRGRFGR